MEGRIGYLRICFIAGAIADALLVPPLIFPKLAGPILGLADFAPDPVTLYLMHVGAALMAGWTGILLWAAAKPRERKGLIPITLFPLLSGLLAAGIYFYVSGGILLERVVPLWSVSIILMAMQAVGYFITRDAKDHEPESA